MRDICTSHSTTLHLHCPRRRCGAIVVERPHSGATAPTSKAPEPNRHDKELKRMDMSWLKNPDRVEAVVIHFLNGEQSDAQVGVEIRLRTGEALTQSEWYNLSELSPEREDCVRSAILATAALTQLLSSWMATSPQTTVGLPRISTLLLTISLRISETWGDMTAYVLSNIGAKKPSKWSRN